MAAAKRYKTTVEDGVPTLWVKSPAYGHSTARRFLGMFAFACSLLLPGATRGLRSPDVVVGSTVHLLAAWAGMRLARRHRVPFVYEIRDIWPETLVDAGALRADGVAARAMRKLSVELAKKAALVVSPLPGVDRYLADHGVDDVPFLWVSNGFDDVPPFSEPDPAPSDEFTFMYLGSVGTANALGTVLDAFDLASGRIPDQNLRLRIVGDGPSKADLIAHAAALPSADAIRFEARIPEKDVVARAHEADVLVANMFDWAVYRYGVSLNKMFAYMSASRPVIFAGNAPGNPISEADCGLVVAADDRDAIADAMVEMHSTSWSRRAQFARNGHRHVVEHYSSEKLAQRLVAGLNDLVDADRAEADA
jgi:glycosyltransferase involved in cell wall biosynthesis